MKTCDSSPETCGAGVRTGPLSAYLGAFGLKDEALGHRVHTRAPHRQVLMQSNLWLVRNGRRPEDINEQSHGMFHARSRAPPDGTRFEKQLAAAISEVFGGGKNRGRMQGKRI
jgi:hypothetical protein